MAVTNNKEFRAWLERQPQEVCIAIAYRAGLRVLPLAMRIPAGDENEALKKLALLSSLRALLIAGVFAVEFPHLKSLNSAAHAANASARIYNELVAFVEVDLVKIVLLAANAAANSANAGGGNFANAAAHAVSAVQRAAVVAGSAGAYADTELHPETLMAAPIDVPPEVQDAIGAHAVGKPNLLRAAGPWTFWAKWYDRAIAGDPLPWDLQEKIALIPNEIWEAGPDAVAEEISRIESDYWAEHLPQAEEVVAREDGWFDVRPSVTADDSLMERIFKQTEFALDLSLNTNCGFSEMCVGFKLLRYTLDNLAP